jgi:hypothetical protein
VGVGGDGPDQLARAVEVVTGDAVGALEGAPAEVLRRLVVLEQHAVDLLDVVLADVADPQLAQRGVEREAPRVAQPAHDDLQRGSAAPTSAATILPSRSSASWAVRSGSNARRRRPARGTGARRGRTRAGRRCGSPRAGRGRGAAAAGPGRSCRRRPPGTRPRACRPWYRTSVGRAAGPSQSRDGRRCPAGPARPPRARARRGRARCCGARRRGGSRGRAARGPTARRRPARSRPRSGG